jgi:ATP-dependent DNA ligase
MEENQAALPGLNCFLHLSKLSPVCCRPYSVLEPELVAQIEFTEWTPDGHLRHSKFVGLREDKKARKVIRED